MDRFHKRVGIRFIDISFFDQLVRRFTLMKDSIISAVIVGGLIGGAIIVNGQITRSSGTEENREIRIMRSGASEGVGIEMMGGETDFEFEGTIAELKSMNVQEFDADIQEAIENAISREDGVSGDGKVKIRIKRGR